MGYRVKLFTGCGGHIEIAEALNNAKGFPIGRWDFLRSTDSSQPCSLCQSGGRQEAEERSVAYLQHARGMLGAWSWSLGSLQTSLLYMTYYPDDRYTGQAELVRALTFGFVESLLRIQGPSPRFEQYRRAITQVALPDWWVAMGFLDLTKLDAILDYTHEAPLPTGELSPGTLAFATAYGEWVRRVLAYEDIISCVTAFWAASELLPDINVG